ncbi:SRPBCC domain-containing protein [Streptomyces sp. DT2A-34]|uniref:SRPBCC domain-containing protein n=1 Tax=Streptomyces sp. DT2A-34 TaxID=3051182 RepID=UPI00265C5445|nr:SRPBCC domain-containing protein [Streptomyces sp. DT2A-34]MDO0913140.1 SRPBCC domain-containing protein [Streptomyces sp. DT2A-34]
MEHEVFVPVAAERLREVLADPVRVARAVPGLQQDAGAEPVAGRLKVRVGGHTITYRGAVRVSEREDGSYAVEGDATEARGSGSVKLSLTVRVREADGGSAVTFEGAASADGRVAEFSAEAVGSAVARLLSRFGEQLGVVAGETSSAVGEDEAGDAGDTGESGETLETLAPGEFETRVTSDFETTPDADDAAAPEPAAPEPGAEVSEPADAGAGADADAGEPAVAEAAHARRTMIGRSAEEVDHAPPRGRYAPVPAPQTVAPSSALRWAAPAAAVVVASAIVVGRMLRRRR